MSYTKEPDFLRLNDDIRQKRKYWRAEEYINSVLILDIADLSIEGKIDHMLKQIDLIDDIKFLPDGDRIAVLLRNGNIHIQNISSGDIIAELPGQE
ncbi:MAG: hypothetical protein JEZ06_21845 [Anaerolineaceae bacterium]|nr:hypothetical protein [Anaerolineaceae bacterium]